MLDQHAWRVNNSAGGERANSGGDIILTGGEPPLQRADAVRHVRYVALAPFQGWDYILFSLERLLTSGGLARLPLENRAAATLRLQAERTWERWCRNRTSTVAADDSEPHPNAAREQYKDTQSHSPAMNWLI